MSGKDSNEQGLVEDRFYQGRGTMDENGAPPLRDYILFNLMDQVHELTEVVNRQQVEIAELQSKLGNG